MRGISEIVSLLVLLAVATIAFAMTLIIVPKYFSVYNKVAVEASYSQSLEGFQTTASLSRYNEGSDFQYLTVIIYNTGDRPIKVNYYIECVNPSNSNQKYFVGEKKNIIISPGSTYQATYRVLAKYINDKVCYLIVEEPNLLIYKVLES